MITEKKLNILIVEDHALTRFGLKTAFESLDYVSNLYEAEDGESAIEIAAKLLPEIVIMDLGLPDIDGIQATRTIKKANSDIKIIILTSHEDEQEVKDALGAGASAYCLKDIAPDRLIQVVSSVADGAAWLDPGIADMILSNFANSTSKFADNHSTQDVSNIQLTDREREVLKLIVDGCSNAEISKQLFVSIHTAKAHVCNILQKLSVDDRTQAAIKALKYNLV